MTGASTSPVDLARERWRLAQRRMVEIGLDAVLIGDKFNYWYLTGHLTREFDKRWRPILLVLPATGVPRALVFAPERRALAAACGDIPIVVYDDAPVGIEAAVELVVGALPSSATRLGVELGPTDRLGLGWSDFTELQKRLPALSFSDASAMLTDLRQTKTPSEIDLIARSAEIALVAWRQALGEFRIGLGNDDVRDIVGGALCRAGSDFNIPGHVTVGNGVAGDRQPYRPGDILWCDFGASFRGYQSDMSRRAVFGPASVDQRRVHAEAVGMLDAMIAACRPGVTAASVASVASRMMEPLGYAPLSGRRRFGHGIGLCATEPPSLGLLDQTILRPGTVITPEPMFTLATGEFVHVEEMVVITAPGARRLTHGAETLHQLPIS